MITCSFTGNIGNHLFQYALTRIVAEKNGYEWGFNRHPSHDYYGGREQMDFLELDYGKEHNTSWGEMPFGIDKIWVEPKEVHSGYNFHPYTPSIFDIEDNTKLVIDCCQDARYFQDRKEDIRKWFTVKRNIPSPLNLDESLCILNVRGGEYIGNHDLLLTPQYWDTATQHMRNVNPNLQFIIITDDVDYCHRILPYPAYHFSIAEDYNIINKAKYLILSNSSFAIFPAWLNEDAYIVAPEFWARHNIGVWANSAMWTFDFHFMNREGDID